MSNKELEISKNKRESELYSLSSSDSAILNALQDNARITNAQLAKIAELSPAGLQKRLRKLEDSGLIQSYRAVLNREQLGLDLLAIVNVTLEGHSPDAVTEFDQAIVEMPEVLTCYRTMGSNDYVLKVYAASHTELDDFLMKKLLPLQAVSRMTSSLVLRQIKETTTIPLPP